jgi:dehydrogenase/reductase SDR family member 12
VTPWPAQLVDAMLEVPIVPSFTNVGYNVRRRVERWSELDAYDLTGTTVVITGATSGLGQWTAQRLGQLGAEVIAVGRNRIRTDACVRAMNAALGGERVIAGYADMGELDQVRDLAERITGQVAGVDVLIHNAGALTATHTTNSTGHESTVASQVLGPFLLTSLLLGSLRHGRPGRVLTMSSGGMYACRPSGADVELPVLQFRGAAQYGRAKRAQVTLNEMWATRIPARETVFHALHPGWVDTPGIEAALPRFRRLLRPALRSAAQGADTLVWLAADQGVPTQCTGAFWLDRRRRSIYKFGFGRADDTEHSRRTLWDWCMQHTGAQLI